MLLKPLFTPMTTKDILSEFPPAKSNLLNILHAIQNKSEQNYLSEKDLKEVADYLNTTYSSVYGVATYYSMFSVKPRGRYILRVCHSPVCRMKGSVDILNSISEELGIEPGDVSKDKLFSLETSECLGLCDHAPVMMLNDEAFIDLTPAKIKEIIRRIKSKQL